METPDTPAKTLSTEARVLCALAAAVFALDLLRVWGGDLLVSYGYAQPLNRLCDVFGEDAVALFALAVGLSLVCVGLALWRPDRFGGWFPVRVGAFFGLLAVLPWVVAQTVILWKMSPSSQVVMYVVWLMAALVPPAGYLLWAVFRDRFGWEAALLVMIAFLGTAALVVALVNPKFFLDSDDWAAVIGFGAPGWTWTAVAALCVWLVRRVPPRPMQARARAGVLAAWLALLAMPCVYLTLKILAG